jgi:hypothetical protein
MTDVQNILGGNGMKFIDAESLNNSFFCLVVNADCVLTTLTTVGGQNLITQYGLGSKTLKQGMLIPCFNGDKIKNVTPASGSVIGYGYNDAL